MIFSERLKVAGVSIQLLTCSIPQRAKFLTSTPWRNLPGSKKKRPQASEQENRARTLQRARTRYFDLVNLNFFDLDKFLTLTIRNPIYTSREIANPQFKNFIDKLRKTHDPNLKYIASIEYQKRGVIHYHLLMSLKYIEYDILLKKWQLGGCYIKRIPNTIDSVSRYMSKYLQKDMVADEDNSEKHKKIFLRSQNLKYPPTIHRGKNGSLSTDFRSLIDSLQFHGDIANIETYQGKNSHLGNYQIESITMQKRNVDIEGVRKETELYCRVKLPPSVI